MFLAPDLRAVRERHHAAVAQQRTVDVADLHRPPIGTHQPVARADELDRPLRPIGHEHAGAGREAGATQPVLTLQQRVGTAVVEQVGNIPCRAPRRHFPLRSRRLIFPRSGGAARERLEDRPTAGRARLSVREVGVCRQLPVLCRVDGLGKRVGALARQDPARERLRGPHPSAARRVRHTRVVPAAHARAEVTVVPRSRQGQCAAEGEGEGR